MSTESVSQGAQEDRPTDLLTGVVGDRCANCQAALASDQRYCLNCGQRRGKPRFPPGSVTAPAPAPPQPPKPTRPRAPASATLVAGVATLLLAMGVGVLIGRGTNNNVKNASAGVQVLTVGGGGAASAGGSTSTDATAAAKSQKSKPVKPTVVHLTSKVKAQANQAAGKVLGNTGNLSSDPTQQVGGSCSGGAGCQGGHFTGNFFGGGQ